MTKSRGVATTMLTVAVVCVAASVGVSVGQGDGDDGLKLLMDRISMLEDRMDRIEYAIGAAREAPVARGKARDEASGTDVDLTDATGGRYMRIDAIEISEHTEDYSKEIDQVAQEVKTLERTLLSEERQLAGMSGSGGRRGSSDAARRRDAQQRVVNQYDKALKAKQRELAALEKAHGTSRQILHGTAGEKVITLHTTRDLSAALASIAVDDYITWTGRPLKMEREAETWDVERIRKLTQQE